MELAQHPHQPLRLKGTTASQLMELPSIELLALHENGGSIIWCSALRRCDGQAHSAAGQRHARSLLVVLQEVRTNWLPFLFSSSSSHSHATCADFGLLSLRIVVHFVFGF